MNLVLIVLAVIVAIVGMIILIYNGLVMKRQRVNQAFADVDVQLKQRQNLIPNLVETVKGYAAHEQETFQQVIAARNAAQAASSPRLSRSLFGSALITWTWTCTSQR